MTDADGDETTHKRAAADAFGAAADAYLASTVHRTGDDLATVAEWCADAERALDVATGAGHTAGAVCEAGVEDVVATDAAPSMVATAEREFPGVTGVVADAERLPFHGDAFDAVTCRLAAHHFPDPRAFVAEVARVLEPDGTFAFEDNIAPEDDTLDGFLNRVERLRDPTHVRSHRESEWRAWLADAGFRVEETRVVSKTITYEGWVDQLDTPAENRRELVSLFADPPAGAADVFDVEVDGEGADATVHSFANLKVVLRATLPD